MSVIDFRPICHAARRYLAAFHIVSFLLRVNPPLRKRGSNFLVRSPSKETTFPSAAKNANFDPRPWRIILLADRRLNPSQLNGTA